MRRMRSICGRARSNTRYAAHLTLTDVAPTGVYIDAVFVDGDDDELRLWEIAKSFTALN